MRGNTRGDRRGAALGRLSWVSWRVVLVALALGVVLMHHVIGAEHSGGMPASPAPPVSASSPSSFHALGSPASSGLSGAAGAAVVTAHTWAPRARSQPVTRVDPSTGPTVETGMVMLMHLCLAVLVGLVALAVVTGMLRRWAAFPGGRGASGPAGMGAVPRAPPVPLRLAQLQVLRL